MKRIKINENYINLAQFLKIADIINSGGEAKFFLKNNVILVNNQKEDKRGRKLYKGDIIEIGNDQYEICWLKK